MRKLLFLLGLLLFPSFLIQAQSNPNLDDSTKYIITKNNGIEYVGYILSDDGREVLILTDDLGKIYIPKSDIKNIKKIDVNRDYRAGEFFGEGVFTTRYQFSTNAFPIKRGDHYAIVNLYGPEVHFSLMDNLSVGIITTWIASPIALALKYTIPTGNEKLNFGLGTLIGSSGYINQARGFGGLHWGMITYGDRRNNITLSAGYGYFDAGNGSVDRLIPAGTYYPIDEGFGYQYFQFPYGSRQSNGLYKGPVIGLAGVVAINAKTSFFIDVMGTFASRNGVYQNITYSNTNASDSDYAVVSESMDYTETTTNFVIMPGMRFQKSEKSAFQVSLAGIIGTRNYRETLFYSNSEFNPGIFMTKRNYSFPFPMVSWFFKF
jgi:hypothetical protein